MANDNKSLHILRYGTNAEQKHIESLSKTFDTLSINGNMLAYTPGSISKFLLTHCIEEGKCFFIDPITHAFQHSIDKIMSYSQKEKKFVVKKSIKNLTDAYGDPIKSKIEAGKIVIPSDFDNADTRKAFCNRVLEFQNDTITTQLQEKGFLEYIEDDPEALSQLSPCFLIPPYFYLTLSSYDSWLSLNIDFLKIALQNYSSDKIYAQIVVNKDILQYESMRNSICNAYLESGIKNILIWIDDFNEHDSSYEILKSYAELIKYFSVNGINIYNLYGGYFSIILSKFFDDLGFKLSGVGHGLEYGESRAVVPVGGGIPTSKYYYYPLHKRLDYQLSTELLQSLGYLNNPIDSYYKDICNCPQCKTTLKDSMTNFSKFENTEYYEVVLRGVKQKRPYASQETKEICLKHYQYSKCKEFKTRYDKGLSALLDELEGTYLKYSELGILGYDSISYLKNWITILRSFLKDD